MTAADRIDAVTALWLPAFVLGAMFLAACALVALYDRFVAARCPDFLAPWQDREPGTLPTADLDGGER